MYKWGNWSLKIYKVLNSIHNTVIHDWELLLWLLQLLLNNLSTLACARGTNRWSEFSPSVWSGLCCILLHVFIESRSKLVTVTVHTGGRSSCVFPACRCGCNGSTRPRKIPQATVTHLQTVSFLGMNSAQLETSPVGERDGGLALCHISYCIFKNGNYLYFTLNNILPGGLGTSVMGAVLWWKSGS